LQNLYSTTFDNISQEKATGCLPADILMTVAA